MNSDKGYPRFIRRLQAVMIDSIILTVMFMSILIIASDFGVTGYDAVILTAVIVLLWEPLLVSITGGTIGHHLIGLKVVSTTTGKNINILASMLRFITKMVLGNLSIAFIFITRYHQAIHDGLVRSVVILKHPETKPDYEVLSARQVEFSGYSYPPVWRRSLMMVLYNIALIFLIGTATGFLLPAECLIYSNCTTWQNIMLTAWQSLWMVGVVAIIILCWKGRVFGCRRKFIKGNQDEN
ncbi:MAG: RDD family protein [Methylophaga sp.]|nr:RDD family protein [Methylophaga sp.]